MAAWAGQQGGAGGSGEWASGGGLLAHWQTRLSLCGPSPAAPPIILHAALLDVPCPAPSGAPRRWWRLRDAFAEIGICAETMKRHRIVSGSLARVSALGGRAPSRVARIVEADRHGIGEMWWVSGGERGVGPGFAWLAPSLSFNLGLNAHLAPFLGRAREEGERPADPEDIEVVVLPSSEKDAARLAASGVTNDVRLARALSLQKVRVPAVRSSKLHSREQGGSTQSPGVEELSHKATSAKASQETEEAFLAALKEFFTQAPRLLAVGDVFGVWCRRPGLPDCPWDQFVPDVEGMYPRTRDFVYFKVVMAEPPVDGSLLVDPEQTRLALQGGACNSAVPVGLKGYSLAEECLSHSADTVEAEEAKGSTQMPAGPLLQPQSVKSLGWAANASWHVEPHLSGTGPVLPVWRQVAALVAPLVHTAVTSMEFRVSALLIGAEGSGRRTAVAAAAEALGLHLISLSCHDIKCRDPTMRQLVPACMLCSTKPPSFPLVSCF
ncbi:unnamed protein product [Ostreobium quekettii]|uniref:Uncharacterized protein n=1 Tax=Ostreobium quekettii TaxID=121088 RepID=A0A8S1JGA0_9CHLO|nr:unnamed protein product [Ostreobium quekettii]